MRLLDKVTLTLSVLASLLALSITSAFAQSCVGLASAPSEARLQKARLTVAQLQRGQVRITFVGHSTFLIESPKGIQVVTDYNDYIRPDVLPDIITMNIAHDTHFSAAPDPRIKHIFPGWNPSGGPAIHDKKIEDVHVRNIPTNTRDWGGGTREFGNSIFVFEIGGLCIAHLGHLHHTLTVQQLGQIGQMDVLLVPVDGSYTLDLDGMVEVLRAIKAPLMIPMHMFSAYGLQRFVERVKKDFEIVESAVPTIVVARETLPIKQRVLVLPGR